MTALPTVPSHAGGAASTHVDQAPHISVQLEAALSVAPPGRLPLLESRVARLIVKGYSLAQIAVQLQRGLTIVAAAAERVGDSISVPLREWVLAGGPGCLPETTGAVAVSERGVRVEATLCRLELSVQEGVLKELLDYARTRDCSPAAHASFQLGLLAVTHSQSTRGERELTGRNANFGSGALIALAAYMPLPRSGVLPLTDRFIDDVERLSPVAQEVLDQDESLAAQIGAPGAIASRVVRALILLRYGCTKVRISGQWRSGPRRGRRGEPAGSRTGIAGNKKVLAFARNHCKAEGAIELSHVAALLKTMRIADVGVEALRDMLAAAPEFQRANLGPDFGECWLNVKGSEWMVRSIARALIVSKRGLSARDLWRGVDQSRANVDRSRRGYVTPRMEIVGAVARSMPAVVERSDGTFHYVGNRDEARASLLSSEERLVVVHLARFGRTHKRELRELYYGHLPVEARSSNSCFHMKEFLRTSDGDHFEVIE